MAGISFIGPVPENLKEVIMLLNALPPNDLEGCILALVWSGISDIENTFRQHSWINENNRPSEEKIKEVFQNLKLHGLIDKEGYITERGCSLVEDMLSLAGIRKNRSHR